MILPTATYRLQFRNGMTLSRAEKLVPHLQELNISHLYCSPVFAATKGSTHGYDVTDSNLIDLEIGGEDGFESMAAACKHAGIGIILDIVPNHLAASLENPWWRSVVEWGNDSPFGTYFDIDWKQKLTLPFLVAPLKEAVHDEGAGIVYDAGQGLIAYGYKGSAYPLNPATYEQVLDGLEGEIFDQLRLYAKKAIPSHENAFHAEMRNLLGDGQELNAALKEHGTAERLEKILDLQTWKPIPWQDAASGLSYRRFFEITGLAGVRVEDPAVFEAMHRKVFDLIDRGLVDGLRIDHIDGLADPEGYLVRLRKRVGPDLYLVVEKILEKDERIHSSWPIQGTTGYEFISALADLLTAPDSNLLDEKYQEFAGSDYDPHEDFAAARKTMIEVNFAGETTALEKLAAEALEIEHGGSAPNPEALSKAVRDVLAEFSVYRTYATERGMKKQDEKVLLEIFERLYRKADHEEASTLACLQALLKGDVSEDAQRAALPLRIRLQHLTGPLIAKSLEDTFFYRYHRLLALNEVGSDPLDRNHSIARFHKRMQERALTQPLGLSALSTHDTKRGEDARARLFTISEAPESFANLVERWSGQASPFVKMLKDGPAPERPVEWMIYQALIGAWQLGIDGKDEKSLAAFRTRFLAYAEKSVREAKLRTNWANGNAAYEDAIKSYIGKVLSSANISFLREFEKSILPYAKAGFLNSLTQTLIKLTAPGIPDIYQGSEIGDFSLVDPDNRRLIDEAALTRHSKNLKFSPSPSSSEEMASAKLFLIKTVLAYRKKYPDLFNKGTYVPLEIEGETKEHAFAFARVHENQALVACVPRLMLNQNTQTENFWDQTKILLPEELKSLEFNHLLGSGKITSAGNALHVAKLLGVRPVALLASTS